MNTNDLSQADEFQTPSQPRRHMVSSRWTWMTMACLLLGVSGGVRAWQDTRFATVELQGQNCPFELKDIPMSLGSDWQLQEGGEGELDDQVKRVAGCSDSLIRTYRNVATGVSVTALILYGPAKSVAGHTPEVCYPAAGYRIYKNASFHAIPKGKNQKGAPADFRSEVFIKDRGYQERLEEVYYSFFQGNHWSPDSQRNWKDFRHHPSMFKVQVQRPTVKGEWREESNPTEQFLSLLLPELESRIARPHIK